VDAEVGVTSERFAGYVVRMTALPAAFTEAIRDRYVILREIGAGGMADVYLAHDVRHNRSVAVKVLKPELAASLGAERFLKEIEIAARLTHPHIVPLHDSGTAAGCLFYVMPFIDGESLRARLLREARIAGAEALLIVEDVGEALSYAHRQGILHRDIKPENILFSEGHPMIADFGIARAVSTADGAGLTRTGMALGTPGYMSPEQAAGDRELDARTDVYSLGCVLYEMLLGEPPRSWLPDECLRLGRFSELSERQRAWLREAGGGVERALVGAMAVRAGDRFETVDAFLAALRAEDAASPLYSDAEVAEIVRRAAEEQAAHPTGEEMSLQSVQQIAREVGISPERVERAARRLAVRESAALPAEPGVVARWLGGPLQLTVERVVDGEVAASAHDAIADEIQATFGTEGRLSTLGGSLTWRAEKPVLGKRRAVQVRVTSRGGATRVQVQERLGELALTIYSGILVGGGIGGVATILSIGLAWLGHGLESGLLSAAWLGGMYALTRWIYRLLARTKRADLDALSERIAGIAAAPDPERRGGSRTLALPGSAARPGRRDVTANSGEGPAGERG
jgi:transposase-like protein